MNRLFFSLFFFTLILVRPVFGAIINLVPCSDIATNLQTAYAAAANGDIIQFPDGTNNWNTAVTFASSKSVSLVGYGTNGCRVVSGSIALMLEVTAAGTTPILISDICFIGNSANSFGILNFGKNAPAITPWPINGPVHIQRCHFENAGRYALSAGYGDCFGVMDSSTIANVGSAQNSFVIGGNEYLSWATANPLGTTNAFYIEDVNSVGTPSNGHFDGYNGAQMVLRFDVFNGTANNGAHGYDSQVTSVRTGEIYGNLFTNITGATSINDWRGGTLLQFSNNIAAPGVALGVINTQLKYYRGCDGIVNTMSNWANVDQVITFSSNPTDGQVFYTDFSPYTFKNTLGSPSFGQWQVKIGANLTASISNAVKAINANNGGSGTLWAANVATPVDWDVAVKTFDATSITVTNKLDGTNAFGWPAAFQHSVIGVTKYTNNGVTLFPCYSWENKQNGTNIGFIIGFNTDSCNGHNNTTNLLHAGRDFFNDTGAEWAGAPGGYTPLTYPHPLRSSVVRTQWSITISSSGASPTITTTEDLLTGSTSITASGSRTYGDGAIMELTTPSTSGGFPFLRWERDGSFYSASTSISLTVDQARTFTTFYGAGTNVPPIVVKGSVTLKGAVSLRAGQ